MAHTLRLPHRVIQKGKALTPDDLADIQQAGLGYVAGVQLENGDVDEDQAAASVAKALTGPNLNVGKSLGGRCNIYAELSGLVEIDRPRIDAINLLGGAISIATLPEYGEAVVGQAVASVKVIPFAVPGQLVEQVVELAAGLPVGDNDNSVVALRPYTRKNVALILTQTPGLKASVLESTRGVTQARLQAMGNHLTFERHCEHSIDDVSRALRQSFEEGCELILICGASVTMDVGDVVPLAILREGGAIDHFGMPVEPGNMLLIGHHGSSVIVNLPGCSRSPKLNGLDWVLQRILAGVSVGKQDILTMGVGGLIKDIPQIERIKLYKKSRKTVEAEPQPVTPRVAAIVLAAGRSRRMEGKNKLLVSVSNRPMLCHVVAAALDSMVKQVIVVTGHEAEEVQQAIADQGVTAVFNPDYSSGISSSVRTGLNSVSDDMDGAIIMLGDMPYVSSEQIDEMIEAFNSNVERDIVAPFRGGRRGNPVLWARRYFPALKLLTGDAGGKGLLEDYAGNIWDLPIGDDAILVDIDTPDALAKIKDKQ